MNNQIARTSNEVKWSNDGAVCFEPITHTYWKGKKQLKGVTSYIDECKNKFDSTAMAIQKSEKPWELLRDWRIKGNESREAGTALHNIFETYFITGELLSANTEKEGRAINFIEDYFVSKKLKLIEVESIVYDEKLASMRDALVQNEKGQYFIFDWKTNKEISSNNYNKWMLTPYETLPDATFYHYSLQLRLYQKMSKDYPIEDCYIIHFEDEKYNFIKAHNIIF